MNFIITKISKPSLKDEKLLLWLFSIKTENYKFRFKLYKDDRNLYYEGLLKVNNSFQPLDLYGFNGGCTEIHCSENNKLLKL
jgi:hypothetical protein